MSKQRRSKNQSKNVSASGSKLTVYRFPAVVPKEYLECRVLLDDLILLIDNFFTAAECKKYVQFIDSLPLELTPPKKRGEAERVNYRMSITSDDFAQQLYSLFQPHIPLLPTPPASRASATHHTPVCCNTNIRVYKYLQGQHFGAHYDDSVKDPITGAKSEWTILIYLTGIEDGVEGGETIFYKDEKNIGREAIVATLTRGTALLHRQVLHVFLPQGATANLSLVLEFGRHGNDCLLHEGSLVRKGVKYVLRSDLMFKE